MIICSGAGSALRRIHSTRPPRHRPVGLCHSSSRQSGSDDARQLRRVTCTSLRLRGACQHAFPEGRLVEAVGGNGREKLTVCCHEPGGKAPVLGSGMTHARWVAGWLGLPASFGFSVTSTQNASGSSSPICPHAPSNVALRALLSGPRRGSPRRVLEGRLDDDAALENRWRARAALPSSSQPHYDQIDRGGS